jgi:hypothetical protein
VSGPLDAWQTVPLFGEDECPAGVVRFPFHAYGGQAMPSLVRLRTGPGATPHIVAYSTWGTSDLEPTATAVRVAPALHRTLTAGSADGHSIEAQRASVLDAVRYTRGLGVRTLWAMIVMAAAIVGAVASFVTSNAPFGLALSVLILVCVVAIGTAAISVYRATTQPAGS